MSWFDDIKKAALEDVDQFVEFVVDPGLWEKAWAGSTLAGFLTRAGRDQISKAVGKVARKASKRSLVALVAFEALDALGALDYARDFFVGAEEAVEVVNRTKTPMEGKMTTEALSKFTEALIASLRAKETVDFYVANKRAPDDETALGQLSDFLSMLSPHFAILVNELGGKGGAEASPTPSGAPPEADAEYHYACATVGAMISEPAARAPEFVKAIEVIRRRL